jgi:hypothetical protein
MRQIVKFVAKKKRSTSSLTPIGSAMSVTSTMLLKQVNVNYAEIKDQFNKQKSNQSQRKLKLLNGVNSTLRSLLRQNKFFKKLSKRKENLKIMEWAASLVH